MQELIKRSIDFFASLAGLILLSPLFALIAIRIKRDSPGPVFYRGDRVGKGVKPFKILKFRTMCETVEAHQGPKITAEDDDRITSLGHFLRDSKLNELPQLINVLKGEMSLVGPRPEDPSFVEHYSDEQLEVLLVRPGITSLASVIYADEEKTLKVDNVADTYLRSILPKKLRLDLIYVRNRSLLLDLDILVRTFMILIPRFRRASLNAEDILMGPVRIGRRVLTWFTIDALIAGTAVGSVALIWRAAGPLNVGIVRLAGAALVMTAVFTIVNAMTGVQKVQWRYASISEAVGLVFSVGMATLILLAINRFVPAPNLPSSLLIVSAVFALIGFGAVRYRRRALDGLRMRWARFRAVSQAAREKVLVVGSGEAGQLTLWLLQNSPASQAFHVVGVVDDDLEKLGTLVHRVPVMGMVERIPEIVEKGDIGLIVFAIHSIDVHRRNEILRQCWKTGARTVVAPDILTFLRKGDSPEDQRAWVPGMDHLTQDEGKGKRYRNEDVKKAVHELADLARHGDYAALTSTLERLDHDLNPGSGEDYHRMTEKRVKAGAPQEFFTSD